VGPPEERASDLSIPSRSAGSRGGIGVFSVTAAAVVFATTWGGAAALSWYTLLSSSSWWKTVVVIGTPAVRAADKLLFLEDALIVSAVVLLAVGAVIFVARRRRTHALGLLWALAIVGVSLWVGMAAAAPHGDAVMWCAPTTPSQAAGASGEEADGSVADRGWSWTRFSLIVVRTVPTGTYETTCRDPVPP